MPSASLGVHAAAPARGVEHRDPSATTAAPAGRAGEEAIIDVETAGRPSSGDLLRIIEASLADDKAIDPVTIQLAGKTALADAMVIATGSSQRHIAAMAEHLLERLKAVGLKGLSAEGGPHSDWILIDAGDVVVHLFKDEVRRFYDLEKLWGAGVAEAPAAYRMHA